MKKVSNWILNHLVIVLALIVFPVTLLVIGLVMLNSYTSYQAYEKRYDATDLEVRSQKPAAPKRIEFEDDFVTYKSNGDTKSKKSSYKNEQTFWANYLDVKTTQENYLIENDSLLDSYVSLSEKGGEINITLSLEEKAFLDIDFVISSGNESTVEGETVYGVENLLANVDFVINGEKMDEIVDLTNDGNGQEWHHLVMAGFALPEGNVTIQIKSQSGKNALMPDVRNISFFASAPIEVVEA